VGFLRSSIVGGGGDPLCRANMYASFAGFFLQAHARNRLAVSVFLGLAEKSWALQTPISSLIIGEEKEQKMAKL
jgi:hypothetical protein